MVTRTADKIATDLLRFLDGDDLFDLARLIGSVLQGLEPHDERVDVGSFGH